MTIPQDQQDDHKPPPFPTIRALSGIAIGGGAAVLALIAVGEFRPTADLANWYIVSIGVVFLSLCLLGWAYYIHETRTTRKLRDQLILANEATDYWQQQYGRLLGSANPPDPGS